MYIITYDISNDRVRTKFSKFIEKYGRRIQYSVYEIRNSRRVLKNILNEVQLVYKKQFKKTDSVQIFYLCRACKEKIVRFGYPVNEDSDVVIFE